jgi:hypothetical protein
MHPGHLAAPSSSCSYTSRSSPNLMSPALAISSFNRDNTRICPPWVSSALRVVGIAFLAKKSPIVWTLMRTLTSYRDVPGCRRQIPLNGCPLSIYRWGSTRSIEGRMPSSWEIARDSFNRRSMCR